MIVDAVVIGGGFFGMYLAEHLALRGMSTLLFEQDDDFMQRASLYNQARVHQGYHYPRSMRTALRSRVSLPKFSEEFAECVDREVESYYLIGKILGNVTAAQFMAFCGRIGAPCEPVTDSVAKLTNPALIEATFRCVEYPFDAVKLKAQMKERITHAGVDARLSTRVEQIERHEQGLRIQYRSIASGASEAVADSVVARRVFNCTYSMLNGVLDASAIPRIPLKHELAELALVEAPPELDGVALTTMCGPFFSIMPFPSAGLHSFSHVRYTPHCEWYDGPGDAYRDAYAYHAAACRRSAWRSMILDAQRYIPMLAECRYERSLWEVKTVLPRSETNDDRPILFETDVGHPGLHCILGGKIDNVYDAVTAIDREGLAS